jgi:hypothetical protein
VSFVLLLYQKNTEHEFARTMDGSDINSANRQTQAGNIYYIQNNYEVVYENSGNTHNFKMQDSANHSNC